MAELGPGHDYLVADLASQAGIGAAAALLSESSHALLVNNAGAAVHGDFVTVPLDAAMTVLDLNCRAVVTLAQAFLRRAEPGSTLVNVSSTLGLTPKPGLAVYSATKAFVTAFSEAVWHEQKPRGVHVMALCPGVTATQSQTADDVPAWLVQSPLDVVDRALEALADRTGPTVHTSRKNRLVTTAIRLLPHRTGLSLLAD
jgi:short-subunit dehydrogenase